MMDCFANIAITVGGLKQQVERLDGIASNGGKTKSDFNDRISNLEARVAEHKRVADLWRDVDNMQFVPPDAPQPKTLDDVMYEVKHLAPATVVVGILVIVDILIHLFK